jgi:single-strand DNA-binding protein
MASVNKAIIIGNLGRDPELRHTTAGTPVCEFSVATSERYQDKSGEQQEKTEWHRIIVWGRQGENCAKYLAKGRTVYIEGRIQTRDWTDKDGNKRYTTEIVANTVQFLSSARDGGGRGGYDGPPAPSDDSRPASAPAADDSFSDDEIPF